MCMKLKEIECLNSLNMVIFLEVRLLQEFLLEVIIDYAFQLEQDLLFYDACQIVKQLGILSLSVTIQG